MKFHSKRKTIVCNLQCIPTFLIKNLFCHEYELFFKFKKSTKNIIQNMYSNNLRDWGTGTFGLPIFFGLATWFSCNLNVINNINRRSYLSDVHLRSTNYTYIIGISNSDAIVRISLCSDYRDPIVQICKYYVTCLN